jgi:hypothetical protein
MLYTFPPVKAEQLHVQRGEDRLTVYRYANKRSDHKVGGIELHLLPHGETLGPL